MSSSTTPYFNFKVKGSTEDAAHEFGEAGWSMSFRDPPVSSFLGGVCYYVRLFVWVLRNQIQVFMLEWQELNS